MRAHDIEALMSVSRPSVAPDGSLAVVSVTHPALDSDATVGQLWSVALDGSSTRRLTRGRLDTQPRFSPDGACLAFLRTVAGSAPQLYTMRAEGGEAIQLTDATLGVEAFTWSPDSARIAYIAAVAEQGRYGTVEGIAPGAEPARHITTLTYKYNGTGYVGDQRPQVFTVDVPPLDAEPGYIAAPQVDGTTPGASLVPSSVQVTSGDFSWSTPRYIDGRLVALAARHDTRDLTLLNQLWEVQPGAEPRSLTDLGTIELYDVEQAPDGAIYAVGVDMGETGVDFAARNAAVYRLDGRTPVALTDAETTDVTGQALTVTGEGVLVPALERGRQHVLSVVRAGGARAISSGDYEVTGVGTSGTVMVVSYQTSTSFGEVGMFVDGVIEPLTDFGAALRDTGLVAPEELTITARDGYEVHGWLARPAGEGPHPTLLMIHGGPYTQYGVHAFDETQIYVDAGFAVVYCNPRGSAGYGQAHGRAIIGDMGSVDLTDVLDFLDGALDAYDDLDAERLGILGGSYGGYLTAWAIAHDHRFKAAVVERGYLDPSAFIGSSDIGRNFPQQYNGVERHEQRRQSPQEVAHQVRTPTLVIHSELDLRCPLAQAETYYATLKLQGTAAELLIFPGENHELSRSGRPRHRVQRFEAILDWFGRHL